MPGAYLSEHLAMPERLDGPDGIDAFVTREIRACRRSSFSNVQRRSLLLAGSSLPAAGACTWGQPWPEFIDVRDLDRTPAAISLYLARLVAPDHLSDAREVIEGLLCLSDRQDLAHDVAELALFAPEIATALLELRIGRAALMMKVGQARSTDGRYAREFDYASLLEGMLEYKIAYVQRMKAQDLHLRLHAPLGWDALDRLEEGKAGGTLHTGTAIKAMGRDLELARQTFDLFLSRTEHGGAVPAKMEATFARLGLDIRARLELALWRAPMGSAIEPYLRLIAKNAQHHLSKMRDQLDERVQDAGWNSVVGNHRRVSAGVCLHYVAEQVIAWTHLKIGRLRKEGSIETDDWDETLGHDGATTNMIAAAVTWVGSSQSQRGGVPIPRRDPSQHAAVTDLYMALRFAFLQDDEMLPHSLRQIIHPVSGEPVRVKSNASAARVRGRPYDFGELWEAYKAGREEREDRLAAKPRSRNGKQMGKRSNNSIARQFTYDDKRLAAKLRKWPEHKRPSETTAAMSVINDAIERALTAP